MSKGDDQVWSALRAAPPAPVSRAGWLPIETAPKDGTAIDLWVDGEFSHRRPGCFWGLPHHCCGEMGSYCDSEWHDLEPGWVDDFNQPLSELDRKPTHWMPLPAEPGIQSAPLNSGAEEAPVSRADDYPKLLAFFEKYALGPMRAPSCLVCGHSTQDKEIGVSHSELLGIVVCKDCRDSAQPAPLTNEGGDEYRGMFEDAVRDLAAISAALGIPDDEAGGAGPILNAIEELKKSKDIFVDAESGCAFSPLNEGGSDVCDECHGTGQVCTGYSGLDSDGNAPEFERCPECGYGEGGKGEGVAWPCPTVIDRTHPNRAYLTLGFGSGEECTRFIKATRLGSNGAPKPSAKALTDEQIEDLLMPLLRQYLGGNLLHQATYSDGRSERPTTAMRNLARALLADHSRDATKMVAEQPSEDKREPESHCRCEEPGEILEGYCQECGEKVGKGPFAVLLEGLARDAERYRKIRSVTQGKSNYGPQFFWMPIAPIQGADIFKGSVAQHLDNAIDAEIAKGASN